MKLVILLITHQAVLDKYEIISLKQCFEVFKQREIRLIVPQSLDTSFYTETFGSNIKFDKVEDKWLEDYHKFNKL